VHSAPQRAVLCGRTDRARQHRRGHSVFFRIMRLADSEEAEARKKTAVGLSEMAELYAKADPRCSAKALRHLGLQLSVEQDSNCKGW